MTRAPSGSSLALICLLAACSSWRTRARADAADALVCHYQQNVQQTCGVWACVPLASDDEPAVGAEGRCGRCSEPGPDGAGASQCGDRACRDDGQCDVGAIAVAPEPIRPSFHLLVADVTIPFADASGYSYKPIVAPGYLYQLAFSKTEPVSEPDGGWSSTVPHYYLDLGASLALAGSHQNLFANAGASFHLALRKAGISHLSLGALYQRTGSEIWNLPKVSANVDRLGPYLGVGFLYNLFLRVSYVWALNHQSPQDHAAFLLSIVYMHDLIDDLVPDRFKKHIPEKYRDK